MRGMTRSTWSVSRKTSKKNQSKKNQGQTTVSLHPVAVDPQRHAKMLASSLRLFKKRDGALVWFELAGEQSNFQSPASSSRRPLHLGFIFNQKNTGNVSDPFGLLNRIIDIPPRTMSKIRISRDIPCTARIGTCSPAPVPRRRSAFWEGVGDAPRAIWHFLA